MKRLCVFFLLSLFLCVTTVAETARDVRIIKYDADDGLLDADVSCGLQDHIGYAWFATHDGLVRYNGHSFKTYKARNGDDCPLFVNRIDYIAEDMNHDILCYSNKKWFRFKRATSKFEEAKEGVTGTRRDESHFSAIENSLKKLDEYKGLNIKVRLVDRQGGIWVNSTRGLERVVYVRKKIKPDKDCDGNEELVRGLMYDSAGRIWVADKNGCVRIYRHGKRKPLYLGADGTLSGKRTLFGHNVYALHEDSRGRIWLGTKPDGIFILEPYGTEYKVKHYEPSDAPYSLCGNSVYSIIEDSKHRIWIGTYGGGLNIVKENKDGTLDFINKNNLLKNYPDSALYVHGMDMNKAGILVVGTDKGLYTCNSNEVPSSMTFYRNIRRNKDRAGLGANNITDVVCDDAGTVYVTTCGGGISKVLSGNLLSNNVEFKSFTSADGFAADVYLTLVADHRRNLWCVGKYALTEFNATNEQGVVNYRNGLFEGDFQFSEVRPLCLPDGTLVFGTTQGFLRFNPRNIKKSGYVPKIVFDTPGYIELPPGKKNIRIEFATLDFDKNEDIVYKYMLEGIDGGWHYTKENSVDYTNFPIGTYKLHVVSTNSDGIWVNNESVITIKRCAAFHEMWYSWMLYGILSALILWGIYKTLKYITRLKKEMYEHRLETDAKLDYLGNRVKELMDGNTDVVRNADDDEAEDQSFAERAKDFVVNNISNSDLSVNDFARHMNMSTSLLYIRCKKNLGYTPNNYIQNVRIKYAVNLIESGSVKSVSEVAYKCGFSDPKYFSRCFKKITGLNPTDYKNKQEHGEAL